MLRDSLLIKKILRNVALIIICIALYTALNVTNISFNKMLTIKNETDSTKNIEVIGASYTDVMIQRWGYLIFAVVIIIASLRAIKAFKNNNTSKVLKNIAIIPGYLVAMFVVIIFFDLIFRPFSSFLDISFQLHSNLQMIHYLMLPLYFFYY